MHTSYDKSEKCSLLEWFIVTNFELVQKGPVKSKHARVCTSIPELLLRNALQICIGKEPVSESVS